MFALVSAGAAATLWPEGLEDHAKAAKQTVERQTVSGSVGPIETPLTLEASAFLLDHPDLSAWLVRRRKIAPYVIEMRGSGRSWADDGDGTTGFIDLVYRRPERRVYYTEGTHSSVLFPDIRASAVIFMDISAVPREGCREHVVSSFEVYVKLRSGFLSAMVKGLRPFIKGLIVRKFTRAFAVADQVGVLLARDPEGVGREILSYPALSAEDRAAAQVLLSSLPPEPESCLRPALSAAASREKASRPTLAQAAPPSRSCRPRG